MNNYQEDYKHFLEDYKKGSVGAEMTGEMVAYLASLFISRNLDYTTKDIAYNVKLSQIMNTPDKDTGKFVSAVKATADAEASDEYKEKALAKAHVTNLECLIQATKTLQRGLIGEQNASNSI